MRRVSLLSQSTVVGCLLLSGASLALPEAARAGEKLFSIADPRGDDRGDGSIRYPLNYYGLTPGDLDLLEFSAKRVKGGSEFEVVFANSVKSPARRTSDIGGGGLDAMARLGFYAVNVDVYIDMDRKPGSGGVNTMPGRKATIAADSGWERAVILTPRPFEAKSALKRSLLKSLKEELKEEKTVTAEQADHLRAQMPDDVERHVFFPTRVRPVGSKIRFFVPDEFLGGPARADWGYVVVVSGADIDSRFDLSAINSTLGPGAGGGLFILPVKPGGAQDRFGGRRDDDFTQPPILDLVVPKGQTQERVLSDYDPVNGRFVVLSAVVPSKEGN